MRVSFWTRELTFQVGKRTDDVRGLEGAIAAADLHLLQNAGIDEPLDRIVGRLKASADKVRSPVQGENRCLSTVCFTRTRKSKGL